jgi:hypothetical protein
MTFRGVFDRLHVAALWFCLGFLARWYLPFPPTPLPNPIPAPVVPVSPEPLPIPRPKPQPQPTPQPEPEPTPKPPVKPEPVRGTIWINWLSSPTKVTQAEALIAAELATSKELKSLDARFTLIREGQAEMERTHMDAYARQLGYPCVVIVNSDGHVLTMMKSPASANEVLHAVRLYR